MPTADDPRNDRARLAAQLRANLHRRKAQARGLAAPADAKADDASGRED